MNIVQTLIDDKNLDNRSRAYLLEMNPQLQQRRGVFRGHRGGMERRGSEHGREHGRERLNLRSGQGLRMRIPAEGRRRRRLVWGGKLAASRCMCQGCEWEWKWGVALLFCLDWEGARTVAMLMGGGPAFGLAQRRA